MEPQFISFFIGLLVGGSLGAAAMAVVSYNRSDDPDIKAEAKPSAERRL